MVEQNNKLIIWATAVLVCAYAVLFYALPLANRPFYTRGEGREALVVSSMYDQNNFILPLRGGRTIPSKPPMFHWMGVLASEAFGQMNEFSIRFPSALCAALGLALFFAFIAYHSGINMALLSTLIAGTSLEWFRNTTHARVDMVFNFWLTLSCLCLFFFWKDWLIGRSPKLKWYLLSGITVGGTVLAKGPAGLLIPWLITGIFIIVETKKEGIIWLIKNIPYPQIAVSLLISLLIAGTWYFLAYQQGGMDFIKVQLLKENVARLVDIDAPDVGHPGPFYDSFLFLLMGFSPWTIFLPVIVLMLWQQRKELIGKNRLVLFNLIWVVVFLLAVSVSRSKREVYLLPIYLPLSYLLAYSLFSIFESTIPWRYLRLWNKVIGSLLTVVVTLMFAGMAVIFHVCFLGYHLPIVDKLQEADQMQVVAVIKLFTSLYPPWILIGLGMVLLLQGALAAFFGKLRKSSVFTGLATLLILFATNVYVMPVIFAMNSPREFIHKVVEFVDDNGKLYEYKSNFYAASFYADRRVYLMQARSDLPQEGAFVLVAERDLDDFKNEVPEFVLIMESKTNAANGRERMYLTQVFGRNRVKRSDGFI